MKKNDVTEADRKQMAALLEELKYVPAIADRMGLSVATVRTHLRKMGLVGRQTGKSFCKPNVCERNREVIFQMLKQGKKLYQIQARIGTNCTRLKEFLKKNGVDRKFPRACGPGNKNGHWKGGRLTDKQGYISIHQPNHPDANFHGYVREHRLVMEKMIGRRLLRNEVVHHKNSKPGDNRPENLELFDSNARHLAVELLGRVPKWTKDGRRRIREGLIAAHKAGLFARIRKASKQGAQPSPLSKNHQSK